MADIYIWYALCMPFCTYSYTDRRIYICICVLMCAYYSNYIAIMSNICDRTDTSTYTYFFMVKYI